MSDPIFPSNLPGLTWPVKKVPRWATRVQRSVSGRELRIADQAVPIWEFTLPYNPLRDKHDTRISPSLGGALGSGLDELRTLLGFYLYCQGPFLAFLFDDPTDDAVVGTGLSITGVMTPAPDGSNQAFQLSRQLAGGAGQFVEPVFAPNVVSNAYINGVDPGGWTVNPANGIITFGAAPGAGTTLSWTGSFYFRCRFSEDQAEFSNDLYQIWSTQGIKFRSIIP